MNDIYDMAMNIISKNPNAGNNPVMQRGIEAIRNHDNTTGEQIARNICESYGITPEEALKQIGSRFNF